MTDYLDPAWDQPDENGIYPWGDSIPWPPEADLDYD